MLLTHVVWWWFFPLTFPGNERGKNLHHNRSFSEVEEWENTGTEFFFVYIGSKSGKRRSLLFGKYDPIFAALKAFKRDGNHHYYAHPFRFSELIAGAFRKFRLPPIILCAKTTPSHLLSSSFPPPQLFPTRETQCSHIPPTPVPNKGGGKRGLSLVCLLCSSVIKWHQKPTPHC